MVEALDELVPVRGGPKTPRGDNGPAFVGRMLDQWAQPSGGELAFSRPGTPTDNAVKRGVRRLAPVRCPKASWFPSMADAQDRIEDRGEQSEADPTRPPAA